MHYPNLFLKWGDFELKGLIVPLLQIIMFGMGTAMSLKDFGAVIKSPKAVFYWIGLSIYYYAIIGCFIGLFI